MSVYEEHPNPNRSPEIDRDYEDIAIEWDLATTHQRNIELKELSSVKEFFERVKKIKSIWDKDTREWLATLPYTMSGEAIPLFESSKDEVSEDYGGAFQKFFPMPSLWLTWRSGIGSVWNSIIYLPTIVFVAFTLP